MNLWDKEIQREKLRGNLKRQNYLKSLSISCLMIDLFSYIILESIEMAFRHFTENYLILLYFALKVKIQFNFLLNFVR